ncbi:MAG: Tol-Pal system subunit TolQ [Deltaproteobacteria bacterium]|nr:Tol-Pal system subunit TolQ [Deltaproteobacteria bacterium]
MEESLVYLVTLTPQTDLSIMSLLKEAGWVVKLVLTLLIFMSCYGGYVIIMKLRQLNAAEAHTRAFLTAFWEADQISKVRERLPEFQMSPVAQCFNKATIELDRVKQRRRERDTRDAGDLDLIARALTREQGAQRVRLLETTPYLATIASLAPFIGLFGTVWGIMDAFLSIAQEGNASLATVAPPIAEALIATAVGLFAAIPAVFGYNLFMSKIRVLSSDMETFSSDLLNLIKRNLD